MKTVVTALAALALITTEAASIGVGVYRRQPQSPPAVGVEVGIPKAVVIRAALSAAPVAIAQHAAVIAAMGDGKTSSLRRGTNGFTCIPGEDASEPGRNAMCLNEQAMLWLKAFRSHAAKPLNTASGIVYMLQGYEAQADTTGQRTRPVPHWELTWPVDPETTGLSTEPKESGTWVMEARTPYAHLMIYQVP